MRGKFAPALVNFFVSEMLTRDLFAVAFVLTFYCILCGIKLVIIF